MKNQDLPRLPELPELVPGELAELMSDARIETIEVAPGDIVVIKLPGTVSQQALARAKEGFDLGIPNVKVVFLVGDAEIVNVLRPISAA
jgi:hypothetical protein